MVGKNSKKIWEFSIFSKLSEKISSKYFFEVGKKIVYSFDAEKAYLSIGDIFKTIRAA